jgi:hypothetical protein
MPNARKIAEYHRSFALLTAWLALASAAPALAQNAPQPVRISLEPTPQSGLVLRPPVLHRLAVSRDACDGRAAPGRAPCQTAVWPAARVICTTYAAVARID